MSYLIVNLSNSLKIDQLQCRLAMSTAELAKGDLKATYSATDNTIDVKQKSFKFNMFVPILEERNLTKLYITSRYMRRYTKKKRKRDDSVDDDVWLLVDVLNYKTVDVSGQKYAKISIHNKSSTIQFPFDFIFNNENERSNTIKILKFGGILLEKSQMCICHFKNENLQEYDPTLLKSLWKASKKETKNSLFGRQSKILAKNTKKEKKKPSRRKNEENKKKKKAESKYSPGGKRENQTFVSIHMLTSLSEYLQIRIS